MHINGAVGIGCGGGATASPPHPHPTPLSTRVGASVWVGYQTEETKRKASAIMLNRFRPRHHRGDHVS